MFRLAACCFLCCVIMAFSGCEGNFTEDQSIVSGNAKIIAQTEEGISGYASGPGGQRMPYPVIQQETYIPRNPAFAGTKTLAWKITWPANQDEAPEDKVPTMFSTVTGNLNSFAYLNSVDSMNTFNARFSLYYENRLIEPTDHDLWGKLTYLNMFTSTTYENVFITRITDSPATVESWVKDNPGILKTIWPDTGNYDSTPYQEGDMFMFYELVKNRYGVIRIVSMQPRIIEVYLAVPNIHSYSSSVLFPDNPGK
jgi:hypothetical protein